MRLIPFSLLAAGLFLSSAPASAQAYCDPGYTLCDDGCMPSGSTCCHDGQHYCDSAVCCANGTCGDSAADCSGAGGSSGSGGFSGSGGSSGSAANGGSSARGGSGGTSATGGASTAGSSGQAQCATADIGADACDSVRSCCDTTGCWYTADGSRFPCSGFDCYAAAEDVVDFCKPRGAGGSSSSSSSSSDSDTDESSGCTLASGHSSGSFGSLLALGAVASLAWRRRRKQS